MKHASAKAPLEALRAASLNDLRQEWRSTFGEAPPAFRSRELLLRALLYRLEAARHGGLKPALKKRMTDLAARFAAEPDFDPAPRRAPAVGSALVRDWNGVRHIVLVAAEGYQYQGATYASLTQVARAISGTHQSGPRFFGLVGDKLQSMEPDAP